MGHQKLHLIGQNAPIAQNHVFPQRWHVRRVDQRHARFVRLLIALALIATVAGRNAIHPRIFAPARERHDVFALNVIGAHQIAAIGANIAISRKKFMIGERGDNVKWIDFGI